MPVTVKSALMSMDIGMAMETTEAMAAMEVMDGAMVAKTMFATIEATAVVKRRR